MKKYIITSLIALSLSGTGVFAAVGGMAGSYLDGTYEDYLLYEDDFPDATLIKSKKEKFVPEDVQVEDVQEGDLTSDTQEHHGVVLDEDDTIHSVIYNSVLTSDPRTMHMPNDQKSAKKIYNSEKIPVFKRTRIKVMNLFRERQHQSFLKDVEKEKKQLEEYEKELEKEKLINDVFYSSQEKKEAAEKSLDAKVEEVQVELSDAEKTKVVPLKGKLKKTKGENLVVLDAKNVYYVEATDEIIAEKSAVVKFPKQKITMRADKFVYSNSANIIKAVGNVRINHSGHEIFCDYVQVNVNEEDISFENINADMSGTIIKAENGYSKDNTLYLYNGYLSSEGDRRIGLQSRTIKGFKPDRLIKVDEEDKFYLQQELDGEAKSHFDVEKISVNAKRDHDVITLKNIKIKYGDEGKEFKFPSLKAYMDKQHSTFEANYPEFGSVAKLGMFIGPGAVFEVPRAGTLKVMPLLNYRQGELGFGGGARYKSMFNTTELYYGSVMDLWVLKGQQSLDDKLSLSYGMNYFQDQWFLGRRRPKYALELRYTDKYVIPGPFKKGLNLQYKHMGTVGYYHNSMFNMNFEKFNKGNIGTLRARYMAELDQELYKYIDNVNKRSLRFSALMQGSAAVYGTGDTQFIGRLGVRARTQYKYWTQTLTYFLTGWDDHTPMKRFDAYRYGTSSVRVREAIRVCKFLSLAWSGMLTLSDDSPNGRMIQENAFLIVLGPDDVKVTFAYDFVRKRTYFTIGFSLNTTGSTVNYKTLEIKNPEKLANNDGEEIEELQPEFWLIQQNKKVKAKPLQYAKVINLSNDDKERID